MVRPSVILSVRYRNHFPVVQFQNQAHIWNPYDPAEVFKTMGAAGARNMGRHRRPNIFKLSYAKLFILPIAGVVYSFTIYLCIYLCIGSRTFHPFCGSPPDGSPLHNFFFHPYG